MDPIADTFGSNRIIHGVAVPHPLANPQVDKEKEFLERKAIVKKALQTLENN